MDTEEPGEADDDQEMFDSRAEGSGVNHEDHRAAGTADPAQGVHPY